MASIAAETARSAGAEVRLMKVPETAPEAVVAGQEAWQAVADETADIPEVTPDDMVWADAYLFSAPTRYGVQASQMRAFIDTLGPIWAEGKLANKAISAMSSAQQNQGGPEQTLMSFYATAIHWGCVIQGHFRHVLGAAEPRRSGANPDVVLRHRHSLGLCHRRARLHRPGGLQDRRQPLRLQSQSERAVYRRGR